MLKPSPLNTPAMSHPARPPAAVTDTPATASGPSLEGLLLRERRTPSDAAPPVQAPFVGLCVDSCHPDLRGRALIRWTARGSAHAEEQWLPCLQSLALREGDRVMVTALSNLDEPVVIGVLDGVMSHRNAPAMSAHSIVLGADERIRVHAADGTPLVEIGPAVGGPVVQVLSPSLALRVAGQLALDADSIDFRARSGPVVINASRDVVVNGERIRLNSPDEDLAGAREIQP